MRDNILLSFSYQHNTHIGMYSMVYHVMARVVFRTTILYFSPDDKFNL